mmetsp:Transcript_31983/g.75222  ORF Transcript_31983/g.75222 Transcript_31983/m.75222 type:complete len:828 (-) Transcript_31983:122-2605(-)|eukprot:CAMPEP_0172395362 /NCGR_PEP_ID=MMETSP1061-20121228/19245_1 /TAXON_ID=37318 /ORGANISM="Pseudo-nitzschia pungens, Strain cf. pungens" /LENGTH=827 /DNA_ID=CAMNT_0013126909 /DNA_START=77 /DNA_END=2560 /DNA_ORIENTATION=+
MASPATLRADHLVSPSALDPKLSRNDACRLHEGKPHWNIDVKAAHGTNRGSFSQIYCSRRNAENTPGNDDDTKLKNVSVVSPATTISWSSDNNEDCDDVNPIDINDSGDVDQSQVIRMISEHSIREISIGFGSCDELQLNNSGKIQKQGSCDSAAINDGQDWAKNISCVADSSGNLVEDIEGDDSSTSSITTIIDSEHNSLADPVDLGDDLVDLFDPKVERGNSSNNNNDLSSMGPLERKTSDLFAKSKANIVNDKNNVTGIPSNKSQKMGPKTSKINPMTGKKALTDDMQEWRKTVSSSVRLKDKKPMTKSEKKKKGKNTTVRTATLHSYPLRRGASVRAQEVLATTMLDSNVNDPGIKKCRLLQDIAPYNLPGIKNNYGCGSAFVEDETRTESNNEWSPKQTETKIVCHDNDSHKARNTMSVAKVVKKSNASKMRIGELKKLASHNAPGLKTMGYNLLGRISPRDLENDHGIVANNEILATGTAEHSMKRPNRKRSHPFWADVKLMEVKSVRVIVGGKVFIPANKKTDRLIFESQSGIGSSATSSSLRKKNMEYNPSQSNVAGRRQMSTQKPSKKAKTVAKQPRRKRNADVIETFSIRIAKKFWFNPSGRKGREWLKTYFGTVVNKREVRASDGTSISLWHVVYDDGDEEDFDELEYHRALDLYKDSDDNCEVETPMQSEEKQMDPKLSDDKEQQKNPEFTANSKQLSQSSHETKENLLQIDGQLTTENGSLFPQQTVHAEMRTKKNSDSVKRRSGRKIDRRRCAKRKIDASKKRQHSNETEENSGRSQFRQQPCNLSCEVVDLAKESTSDDSSVQVVDVVDLSS